MLFRLKDIPLYRYTFRRRGVIRSIFAILRRLTLILLIIGVILKALGKDVPIYFAVYPLVLIISYLHFLTIKGKKEQLDSFLSLIIVDDIQAIYEPFTVVSTANRLWNYWHYRKYKEQKPKAIVIAIISFIFLGLVILGTMYILF